MDLTILREKLEQAAGLLEEREIDCWLTFARETSETPDPALKLIFGQDVTWQSAFILTRGGRRIAIVGGPDRLLGRQNRLYDTVLTYDEGSAPGLGAAVRGL